MVATALVAYHARMTSTRPQVTFVIDDLGYGGTQRQLHLLARALSGRIAMRVVSLSSSVDPYAGRLRALGLEVAVIPRRASLDPARVRALIACLRTEEDGIVHAMLEASNGYAFLAARALRRPLLLSLRNNRLTFTGARLLALRWMYRHADGVTVNSFAGRDHLVRDVGVAASRVYLIPNIVPAPAPGPLREAAPGPLVGCVGRLTDQKRFDAVIEAMPAVRRAVPGARLEVVGEGPLREELQSTARRVGADAYTEFVGAVEDPAPRMARYACLVIASGHEGVPNVALEALALGIPVVAVAVGDLARVVVDGTTGVIARDGSPASLAGALLSALTSSTLRESARREGPRTVREHFSEAAARDRLLEVYRAYEPRPAKSLGRLTGG